MKYIDKQIIVSVAVAIVKLDSLHVTSIFTAEECVNKVCQKTKEMWTSQAKENKSDKQPDVNSRIKWVLKQMVDNDVLSRKDGKYKAIKKNEIIDILNEMVYSIIEVEYTHATLEVTGYYHPMLDFNEKFEPILSLYDIVDVANAVNLDGNVTPEKKYWTRPY